MEFHPFLLQRDLLHSCKNNRIQLGAYNLLTRGKRLKLPGSIRQEKKYSKSPAPILVCRSLQQDLIIPKFNHGERT